MFSKKKNNKITRVDESFKFNFIKKYNVLYIIKINISILKINKYNILVQQNNFIL